jgi:hypothetical protein
VLVRKKKIINTTVPTSPESLRRSAHSSDRQRLNEEADYYNQSDGKYYGECEKAVRTCVLAIIY